ncbi:MAG TPA: phytanoyl-CoA dioxygenase family protein, partial [Acidimicrobiia bacterium]|nr:phytanoyl-CoA dioxygenase family protein [Acidimicrobiia bacterium]
DDGAWLHYRELTDEGPKLCRSENFVPFHAGLRALLTEGPMLDVASALLGEPAVLYKEKINYKLAGGAGYSPHQDAPAYRFVDVHVSCMVAVDDATVENGCLEVVSGAHAEVLPMDERGCVRADVVAAMTWTPVEVKAGDTLWFHSRAPHRSGPNRSSVARRALYPTYNAASEGDLRAAYYEQKRAEFAAGAGAGGVQVSLIGDFEGRPVT